MTRKKYLQIAGIALLLTILLVLRLGSRTKDKINAQGVREDVVAAIDEAYVGRSQVQLAAVQVAGTMQKSIDQPENALTIQKEMFDAIACLDAVTIAEGQKAGGDISIQIESMVVNTWARSRSYTKYNARLSGEVFEIPRPDLGYCHFGVSR